MSKEKRYPHWIYPTKRAYMSKKRKDIKALVRALEEVRIGVVWVPGYAEHWHKLEAAVKGLRRAMLAGWQHR